MASVESLPWVETWLYARDLHGVNADRVRALVNSTSAMAFFAEGYRAYAYLEGDAHRKGFEDTTHHTYVYISPKESDFGLWLLKIKLEPWMCKWLHAKRLDNALGWPFKKALTSQEALALYARGFKAQNYIRRGVPSPRPVPESTDLIEYATLAVENRFNDLIVLSKNNYTEPAPARGGGAAATAAAAARPGNRFALLASARE